MLRSVTIAPTPMAASNSANWDGGRPSTWRAYSGSMTRNAPDVKMTPVRASATRRKPGSRATVTAPAVALRSHGTPQAERPVADAPADCGSSGHGRTGSGTMTRTLTRYVAASAANAVRNPATAMSTLAASGPATCPMAAVTPRSEFAASRSPGSTTRAGSALLAGVHSARAAPQAAAMMSTNISDPAAAIPSDVVAEHR
jgi:hypothetical protein